MGDNYEWELSKENIQPLRHGRNISSLVTALGTVSEDHAKHQRNEQRKAMELDIMAYDGPDPLELWSRYIQWVEENYPQGGKESDLLIVLEQCLEKLRDSSQYQSDPRLLDIYLRYLDLTENNAEWFNQLYGAGYFHKLSSFYIHWAETLEACSNFKEGTRIYKLGLQNGAEPINKLEESYKHYQARVASALFKSMTNPILSDENNEPSRNAFGELETDSKAPTVRSGTSVRKFQNNRLLPPSTILKGNNKPIFILDDENNTGGTQSTLISSKVALPIQSVMKAENSLKATKWTEAHAVVNEVVAPIPTQPSFQVHLDDGVPLPSSQRKAADGFSGALKDKAVIPTKLNPQTLFERENPKVRLMCDLNKMMVGHREFSFEEIRRQCYERSGRYSNKTAPTETPVTPVSATALLNVRSKEKGLKNRTPSDVAEVVIQKAKTPKKIGPPPPLKPNEKWQCDINAMYEDGKEWSFEQLRAQYYAARVPVRPVEPTPPSLPENPPVELKIASLSLSEPTATVPSQKREPTTCEVAVQTDLFGLDFDIQLVPRQVVSKTPSPRQVSEQNSGVGVSGSSPTVNTKQALSSVKSWFNASVLLPETKAEPKPIKKSLFSIFKDPSVVDVPDESSHVPPVVPKPFTVFVEPEIMAAAPLQTKRIAVMDENAPANQENVASSAPSMPKMRKPLSAIVPLPPCQEAEEEKVQDDFKENVPPSTHVQEIAKRQLSGILVPSIDIPCDPVGLVEDDMNTEEEEQGVIAPIAHPNVSRALFASEEEEEEEQTRYYCVPLNEDVDFTVPSAMAFANNLRIQSTPLLHTRHQQPLASAVTDEATFNLPRDRALQVTNSVPISATAASSKTLRGLSPIDERSREYFSSSGSSAGTTGLAHSRLSVGRSLHSTTDVARIFPPHFDPFDMEHRQMLITKAIPLYERNGFHPISGRLPWLRSNSSVQLGGNQYIVKQLIGQGAYAKVYEAIAEGGPVVLKVQETDGIWEFYITSELQRRLADSPTACSLMSVNCGYFYDGGSILVNEYLTHGTLLDLINSYKLKNTSMPEALVYHFSLELLAIVSDLHECGILHADIKPDNILLQNPVTDFLQLPENWTVDEILARNKPTLKLIDFGRSIDLALYPDRTAFMHCFQDDKSPEMRDGKPWSYQLDYYGLATTIYTMLMGVHCKILYTDAQWRVPTLKRGHNFLWRDLTTALLNAALGSQLDLAQFRHALAGQLTTSIKPREYKDKMSELGRYLLHKC